MMAREIETRTVGAKGRKFAGAQGLLLLGLPLPQELLLPGRSVPALEEAL